MWFALTLRSFFNNSKEFRMQKTKAFKLLSAIVKSGKDIKELQWFFNGPFVKQKELMLKLLGQLNKYQDTPNHKKFTEENVFKSLYGKHEYFNRKKLLNLCSLFCGILEKYIVYKESTRELIIYDLILAKFYQKQKIFNPYFLDRIGRLMKAPLPKEEDMRTLTLFFISYSVAYHPNVSIRDAKKFMV